MTIGIQREIVGITPCHALAPDMAIAMYRSGVLSILDLGIRNPRAQICAALAKLASFTDAQDGCWGIRWDTLGSTSRDVRRLSEYLNEQVDVLVLGGLNQEEFTTVRASAKKFARRVITEVYDLRSAQLAEEAGFDGIILKGFEASGLASVSASFILVQQVRERIGIPYWIQGGIGINTAPAAILAGCQGIVLAEHLWLTQESPFSQEEKSLWRRSDGSQTTVLPGDGKIFRFFSLKPGDKALRKLKVASASDMDALLAVLTKNDMEGVLPLGLDIVHAKDMAGKYGTVGGIVAIFKQKMASQCRLAAQQNPFGPHSGLAKKHGTKYPVVQGPMARVSDVVPFASTVATAGALPFLGLAALRGTQIRAMLVEARERLKGLPWGVGLLGFTPKALRDEQFQMVKEFKPPFALIAGGRVLQVRDLESAGINTYVHVASSRLLESFLKEGVRKFVFEGSEGGGHVGPLTSFQLWDLAVTYLCNAEIDDKDQLQVLFAGGIHDAVSAAMVATVAAPIVAMGVKTGIQMGSAYLLTREAVETGAIVQEYQDQIVGCDRTVLLQAGVGHAVRCAESVFCDYFNEKKRDMLRSERPFEEISEALEKLFMGRLRIASKGLDHNPRPEASDGSDRYVSLDLAAQKREGMYVIGDIATMRADTFSAADLHKEVSEGSMKILKSLTERTDLEASGIQISNADRIAIVGMACVFPGAANLRTYWENVINGICAIREVEDTRWRPFDFYDPDRRAPDKAYSKWGAFIDDLQFDPTRYGMPPVAYASIEPMQALGLEVSSRAMADAGFDQRCFPRERTAVIFGYGGMQDLGIDYIFRTMLFHYLPKVSHLTDKERQQIIESITEHLPRWNEDTFPGILGNVTAGRVANRLDLGGANFTVDAACASSLAALDVGISRLRTRDADVALVGAVDGTNNAVSFLAFSKVQALSASGHSRPFDNATDGIVIGEGAAALVLKRLDEAERDGDRIYAVIAGIGSSSDGKNRSMTAPHPQGQVLAVKRAYENAGFEPSTVTLVEAHGTGTPVGDKAEIESLNLAFGGDDSPLQTTALGSVKSMIGHTKVAAGLASVIKAVLALNHRVLPRTLGVEKPNSMVDFTKTPFYVNTETRPWLADGDKQPRRAGVSAFGFGGTNFHVALEEYDKKPLPHQALNYSPRTDEIFTICRSSRLELETVLIELGQAIEHDSHIDLSELAQAFFLKEKAHLDKMVDHRCRIAIVATSVSDLKQKIEMASQGIVDKPAWKDPRGIYFVDGKNLAGKACFLFPGQGSQQINMLRDLVVSQTDLHGLFETADKMLRERLPQRLSKYIFPLPVFSEEERKAQQKALNATQIAQPALGVIDLAALKLLANFGLQPDFVSGHSYGEYVALCAAGVIDEKDLINLSEIRGRIVRDVSKNTPGAMAAVKAPEDSVAALVKRLGLAVTPANMNGPEQTVVAGPVEVIEAAVEAFKKEGVKAKRIPVTAAFHSPAMTEAAELLAIALEKVPFSSPQCHVYSNTLGDRYPKEPGEMRALLSRHIAEPVRFLDQVRQLYKDGARIFIEVGPGRVLGGLVDRILGHEDHVTLYVDASGRSGWTQMGHLLSEAFVNGLPVQLDRWFEGRQIPIVQLEDIFVEARKKANPGRHIWRVNGGKILPWYQETLKIVETKREIKKTSEKSIQTSVAVPEMKRNVSAVTTQPQTNIKARSNAIMNPNRAPHRPPRKENSDSLLSGFRANFSDFIGLQQHQMRVMERFLDIQEWLIGTNGHHVNAIHEEPAQPPVQCHEEPSSVPSAVQAHSPSAPLAPVLPRIEPSMGTQVAPRAVTEKIAEKAPAVTSSPKAPVRLVQQTEEEKRPHKGTPDSPATAEEFQAALLGIVSERTGYPEDMLDLDAHMEADLGVDSIKRIEIFNTLNEHHDLLEGRDEETVLEELTSLKTIRRIVEWYEANRQRALGGGGASSKKAQTPPSQVQTEVTGSIQSEADRNGVRRYIVHTTVAPLDDNEKELVLPENALILLLGEAPALSAGLHAGLTAAGYRVRQVVNGKQTRSLGDYRYEVDFSSYDAAEIVRDFIFEKPEDRLGAIFNLSAFVSNGDVSDEGHVSDARTLFLLLKIFEAEIKQGVQEGNPWLINFTALDGGFGLYGRNGFVPVTAGTLGVAKSAAREWPGLRTKCIDLDLDMDPHMLVAQVLEELSVDDPLIEVGLTKKGRMKISLEDTPLAPDRRKPLDLGPDSVVLVTGGAYGITAEIAKAMAEKYRPRFVILGRSPLPGDEPSNLLQLQDEGAIRQYFIERERAEHTKVSPAVIDKHIKRVLKDRQIRRNLGAIESTGSAIEYHALDVRDTDRLKALIDDLYARYGRIDGVFHGAGVIDDKLIRDKSLESFDSVFMTKVMPARVFAEKLRPESLKFVMFFSSVAARFGNAGQSDYSSANEVLNKTAAYLAHNWPTVRVVSINWGPWDSGMVSDALRRFYAAKGIHLVPQDLGVQYAMDELESDDTGACPEIVVASSVEEISELGLGGTSRT